MLILIQANRDLAAKFLKEGTLAHDLGSYATKDGDVFTVNVGLAGFKEPDGTVVKCKCKGRF